MIQPKNYASNGRFPANLILTYEQMTFDEVCGGFPDTKSNKNNANYESENSACRYFYCAKASKKDRDEGLDQFEEKRTGELQGGRKEGSAGSIMKNANGGTRVNPYAGAGIPKKNIHPTVKPTELMQYLVRLVTPENGIILDPFMGSGSTGKACMYENLERNKNYSFIGIEKEQEYYEIAKARIKYAEDKIGG
jgi:site-specific DNA-methyltransferase (adenine-specific)